jgi:two-component system sensor histidine kinase/response regulator
MRAAEGGESIERVLRERHGGAHVLLVDDNLVNQELATELLRIVHLRSDVAGDGRRAVEMAAQGRYDLILMDMQMPEMDGLEATRALRAMPGLDRTPIIAMTASAFGADRAACIAAGMNDHLGKPVHPALLYDTLLRWLDESRTEIASADHAKPARDGQVPREVADRHDTGGGRLEDELASVPGLDVERGLCFFAGRHASYVKALRHFAGLFPEGLAAVGDFIAGRPGASREAVRREVHSFGGASAALGALDAERSARRIDALLRERPSAAETAEEPGLRAELEALHALAATLLARLRQALGPAPGQELRAALEWASPDRPERP